MNAQRKKYKEPEDKWVDHVEKEWIAKKINGHGGSYGFNKPDGMITIGYIGGKSRVVIFWYNLCLFMRYIRRKLWKMYLKCMGAERW